MDLPKNSIDYYELLQVSRQAPVDAIRASYRSMMQKDRHHPDLGGDAATAALLNRAYAVLSNAHMRAEYDLYLQAAEARSSTARLRNPYLACTFCSSVHNYGQFIVTDATCHCCESPLLPAEHRRLELRGQRAVERIDKRQDIVFFTHWPQAVGNAAVTEDISLNGMRFVTRAGIAEGQYIKIVSDLAEAIAQVTNVSRRRRGLGTYNVAGVSFVTLRFMHTLGGFVSDQI